MGDFETGQQALLSLLDELLPINSLVDVQISAVADAQLLIFDAAGLNWKNKTLSGDATISNVGVITIENDAITTAKILDGDVTFAKLDPVAIVTEAEGIPANDNDTTIPTSAAVKDFVDSVAAAQNELGELTDVNITTPAGGDLLIYDGVNSWDNQTVSGDISITSGGVVAISPAVIVDADIAIHTSTKITITNKSQLNSALVYNDQANVFGDFDQTFKDNRILIESPDGLTPTTLINAQQTLARNLTIPILTTSRDIVVTGEVSQIAIGTEVTGASTDLTDTAVIARSTDNLSFFSATSSAQLAGVINDETGSGLLVFGTSPTIVTPTIASFANAAHNHQDAAGGGQLLSTSALSDTANIAYLNTANTYTAGTKQTLGQDATTAGLNLAGGVAADPSGLAEGDFWYNGTGKIIKFRTDVATKILLTSGDVVNADIATGADIVFTKLEALNSANILVGNASNDAASVAMSGDVLISNTGVTSIGSAVIVDGDISVHTSTKITITAKSQLNSSLIYNDQNNSLGAFYLDIDDIAVPANPGAGIRRLFTNTATGELSIRTSGGSTVSLESGAAGGETNTHSSDGGGTFALTAATPKVGVDLRLISVSNGDGMNAALATDVLTLAVASTVVQTDQANVFGDFAQTFKDNQIFIENPADTFTYQLITGAIVANRTITLPILTANETFAFIGHDQLWSGTQTFEDNTIEISNPANTFQYLIQAAAIAADRTLNLPLITGADTLVSLGLAQTFSAIITHSANLVMSSSAEIAMGTNLITAIEATHYTQNTITYNATLAFDFDTNEKNQLTLTGVLSTLTTSNRASGKSQQIFIVADSVDRVLTFNTSWKTNPGDATVTVLANTFGVLSLYSRGTAETDVFAVYAPFS